MSKKKDTDHISIPIPAALNPVRQMKVMGRLVRRAVSKPGTAPGTLIAAGPPKVERVRIRFLDWDQTQLNDNEAATVEQCLALKALPTVSWINIDGIHDVELIGRIGENFGWHPLVMEDVVTPGQRAKVEEYEQYNFLVLPMLSWDPEHREVTEEQVSLVVGPNYVVTFQERYGDVFGGVRERIRMEGTRLRQRGPDYLAYALIDAVVDHYFHVLEAVGEYTEALEEEVMTDPKESTMKVLHHLKRELLTIRRAVWPLREVMSSLLRSETSLFTEPTRVFMRDVYDHAVQVLDAVEALRDVVSGNVDLYLSTVGFRTNEVMKVLTIMSSTFIPLTFLAGIYGMNFEYMPELARPWAYPALLSLMVVVGGAMMLFFKRKGWM